MGYSTKVGYQNHKVTASTSMFSCTRMMGANTIYECVSPKPLVTLILDKTTARTPNRRAPKRTRRRWGAVYAVSSTLNHGDTTPLVLFTGSLLEGQLQRSRDPVTLKPV